MPALPIAEHKATILQAIENNPITIITGETGCGKSTQVRDWVGKEGGLVWEREDWLRQEKVGERRFGGQEKAWLVWANPYLRESQDTLPHLTREDTPHHHHGSVTAYSPPLSHMVLNLPCLSLSCLGWSTKQVPQYIVDAFPGSRVLITQPKRIAAVGAARHVAQYVETSSHILTP